MSSETERWLAMKHASLHAASIGKILTEDLKTRQDELTEYVRVADEMGRTILAALARIGAVDVRTVDWQALQEAVISIDQTNVSGAQIPAVEPIVGEGEE